MGLKRKGYDAAFKARVALEAIREELSITSLSNGSGVRSSTKKYISKNMMIFEM